MTQTYKNIADGTMQAHPDHTFVAVGDELGFSWRTCEMCDALAGDRYMVHAIIPGPGNEDLTLEFEVCQDCLCYVANGDYPPEYDDPDAFVGNDRAYR